MPDKGKKQISAEARSDLMALLKEYARMGYTQTHGSGKGFEIFWRHAFGFDEDKPASPKRPK